MSQREEVIRRRVTTLVEAVGGPVAAYTDARHSLVAPDAVWWLTGLRASGPAVVLVSKEGSTELFVSPVDGRRAPVEAVADRVRVASGHPLAELHSVAGKPFPLVGAGRLTRATRHRLDAVWSDVEAVFQEVARGADEVHLAAFEAATAIAEQAYGELFGILRPGVREAEVVAAFDARLRELGSEDNFLFMSAALHNRAVHRPTERLLQPGDVLLAEISPSVDGVYTQLCRTVVLGDPPPELEKGYDLLEEAFQAGLKSCRPGVEARAITESLNEVVSAAGYGEYCHPPHMRVRGHGLGLGSVLPGDLHADNTVVLSPGDSFVLHPNQYLPGAGYLLYGEPLVITDDGHRVVTTRPAGLGYVPC